MPTQTPTGGQGTSETVTTAALGLIFAVVAASMLMWIGGAAASLLTGHHLPRSRLDSGLHALAHPSDPARAWHRPMPSAVAYWAITGLVLVMLVSIAVGLVMWWRRDTKARADDPRRAPGLAERRDIARLAGEKALLARARTVRPSLAAAAPAQVGYRLGAARGVALWASVEDSMVILGPPRSGKGLHLVVPMILDSPGAVITTATRPDNLTVTLQARQGHDQPVAVFDPQRLAPGVPSTMKWSPIRGCEQPQTAMIRARALAAGTSEGAENEAFWRAMTETALRAFLHAAALDERGPLDLYRWSLNPAAAGEAARVLHANTAAAPGWADALESIIAGDPRTRDNAWAGVRIALSPLADPRVLDAVNPRPGEQFDPAEFLQARGTLYLLGTATGASATAGLVAACVEDVVEVARSLAAGSPGARLDPPLALVLDEAANYVLPSLPELVSEGGGTGITTVAVLQSLAQARARWGENEGAAIWDAAIVKVILGGGSNAKDLQDLSALIGERDELTTSTTRDPQGQRSTSTQIRRIPILDVGRLRTLPFGTGIVMLRAARPTVIDMTTWLSRPDADQLNTARAQLEAANRSATNAHSEGRQDVAD